VACSRATFTFAKVVEKNETDFVLSTFLKLRLTFESFYRDAIEDSRLWAVALTKRRSVASQKTGVLKIKPRGRACYAM
jgi:hypothetical protein